MYDQRSGEMVFRPGPVFTQLLLADEINRTPPKTQAALLEAMGEGQVSMDGVTRPLPQPFIVLATDNPIEYEGTYELPEAQLDRFIMRLRFGYLGPAMRWRCCSAASTARPRSRPQPVTSPAELLAMRTRLSRSSYRPTCSNTSWPSSGRPDSIRRSRSARARAAAWPSCSWPAVRRCCDGATTSSPTTSRHLRARARAPDHAAAGAVGPQGQRRRRGRPDARQPCPCRAQTRGRAGTAPVKPAWQKDCAW